MPNKKEIKISSFNAEKALWSILKSRELSGSKFIRRYSLDKYTIDFFCPERKIAVELDAENFKMKNEYDLARERYILSKGIKIRRITQQKLKKGLNKLIRSILF